MKSCANCHELNEDSESLCTSCGQKVFESVSSPASASRPFMLFGLPMGKGDRISFRKRWISCGVAWGIAVLALFIIVGGVDVSLWLTPVLTPIGVLTLYCFDSSGSLAAAAIAGWVYYGALTCACLYVRRKRVFVAFFLALSLSFFCNLAGCAAIKHGDFHMGC